MHQGMGGESTAAAAAADAVAATATTCRQHDLDVVLPRCVVFKCEPQRLRERPFVLSFRAAHYGRSHCHS